MITREVDGSWVLIRQMDHATHCGEIARAWRGGPYGAESVSDALLHASAYHDLGWTEVDRSPELGQDRRPRNFTNIDERRHTEFYSGAVRTIAEENPSAAYLVSLHASGLYSGRYAWAGLKPVDWTKIGPHGRRLLAGERSFRAALAKRVAPEDLEFEAVWRSYMLLEVFDYLSLLTCFGFESDGCRPVPTAAGRWEALAVRRLGPWEIELDPFPFAGDVLEVEVVTVRIAPGFETEEELRDAFAAAPQRRQRTSYRPARGPARP